MGEVDNMRSCYEAVKHYLPAASYTLWDVRRQFEVDKEHRVIRLKANLSHGKYK